MRRRPLATGAAAAVFACLLACLLAGCGGPLDDIELPPMSAADRATCDALVAELPESVNEQARVQVDAEAGPVAAYGDPPIIVKCGVGTPAGWDTTKSCESANGVGFYIPDEQYDDQSADLTIFTPGYAPVVEIDVPARYRPNANADAMSTLAPLVKKHLTLVEPCD